MLKIESVEFTFKKTYRWIYIYLPRQKKVLVQFHEKNFQKDWNGRIDTRPSWTL